MDTSSQSQSSSDTADTDTASQTGLLNECGNEGVKGWEEGMVSGCVDVASFDFVRDGVSVDNETRTSLSLHLNTTPR